MPGPRAYLAGFHAAQALIFETNGRVFKKHATVQVEFGRLVKDNPRVDMELRAFRGRGYQLKAALGGLAPEPVNVNSSTGDLALLMRSSILVWAGSAWAPFSSLWLP